MFCRIRTWGCKAARKVGPEEACERMPPQITGQIGLHKFTHEAFVLALLPLPPRLWCCYPIPHHLDDKRSERPTLAPVASSDKPHLAADEYDAASRQILRPCVHLTPVEAARHRGTHVHLLGHHVAADTPQVVRNAAQIWGVRVWQHTRGNRCGRQGFRCGISLRSWRCGSA